MSSASILSVALHVLLRPLRFQARRSSCPQVGAFPHFGGRWAEWNGRFRDTVRSFIKVRANFKWQWALDAF